MAALLHDLDEHVVLVQAHHVEEVQPVDPERHALHDEQAVLADPEPYLLVEAREAERSQVDHRDALGSRTDRRLLVDDVLLRHGHRLIDPLRNKARRTRVPALSPR
ncbi:hypothetical protein [Streptomyces sp. NPDC004284]|uniref:hypothetical protein n=1 Tax=Streptomyces sp. NPDC004284 TaxID=3364695 RepID=UPI0036B991D3